MPEPVEGKDIGTSTSSVTETSQRPKSSGFRVQGSEFRVQSSGFRVQGSEFRVQSQNKRFPVPIDVERRVRLTFDKFKELMLISVKKYFETDSISVKI